MKNKTFLKLTVFLVLLLQTSDLFAATITRTISRRDRVGTNITVRADYNITPSEVTITISSNFDIANISASKTLIDDLFEAIRADLGNTAFRRLSFKTSHATDNNLIFGFSY